MAFAFNPITGKLDLVGSGESFDQSLNTTDNPTFVSVTADSFIGQATTANYANTAGTATSADSASNAGYASESGVASTAQSASYATTAGGGWPTNVSDFTNDAGYLSNAAAFAPASHTHSATDITSGTIDAARLPSALTGTNYTAASQSASSGASLMTRDLSDARYPLAQSKKSTADSISSNTTLADVTGLTGFSLDANTVYRFEFTGRMTIAGSSSFQVILFSTAALANPTMSGWSLSTGTRTDNGFNLLSGTYAYYFMQKSGSSTNNPSSSFYYVVTGAATTVKIQFSQLNTSVASGATLLSGAVASFTKMA